MALSWVNLSMEVEMAIKKPVKLPKNLRLRDMREVYEMYRAEMVRCVCGHLKRNGWLCTYCDEVKGLRWGQEDGD